MAIMQGELGLPIQKGFTSRILATNFSAPYNILYGPDDSLWVTDRTAKSITRLDPDNGSKLSVVSIPGVYQSCAQNGLLGFTFYPDFNNTKYIYVAYTYDANPGEESALRTKITRFAYNTYTNAISKPLDLISGLPGSIDHNSGRLIFAPDGKLYYAIGDQGTNQLSLRCFDNRAQDLPTSEEVTAKNWSAYEGKVLRMNSDGSVPADNPIIKGVQSHIFTYGHRNPQGIAAGRDGAIYVSEHGDKTDDEVNRLKPGGNYGWPYVAGYNDGQSYQYVNWSAAENCEDLEFDNKSAPPPGVPVMNESDFDDPSFEPPLVTFGTVENGYNFTSFGCDYLYCWPTVAPSSLRLYPSDVIPGWENNTFLMTTLKAGRIFQLTLQQNQSSLVREPSELFRSENRYRDVAFNPDGRTIYVITDTGGPVQDINGRAANLRNPGSILVFRYVGDFYGAQ